VVKLGEAGCLLPDATVIAPDAVLDPVDTSGAGDAFNGGYLAERMRGADPRAARAPATRSPVGRSCVRARSRRIRLHPRCPIDAAFPHHYASGAPRSFREQDRLK
jgi:sugar/nucleoside kinase (ribokinase family)